MPRTAGRSARAARRQSARAAAAAPLDLAGLRRRTATASLPGDPARAERARRLLLAWLDTAAARGLPLKEVVRAMASGTAARQLGEATRAEMLKAPPPPVAHAACAAGCAFCCILDGPDGGTITEEEARRLHRALAPLAGRPDGRAWHPRACPALDPGTRSCRAYEARPSLCRSFFSQDADACRRNAEGGAAGGAGLLGSHLDHLDVAGLARSALAGVARVQSYALVRLAAAAVEGADEETALAAARQTPRCLEEARRGLASAASAAARPGRP